MLSSQKEQQNVVSQNQLLATSAVSASLKSSCSSYPTLNPVSSMDFRDIHCEQSPSEN